MCDEVVNESLRFKKLYGNNYDITATYEDTQCACGQVTSRYISSTRTYKPGYKEIDGTTNSPARFGT